MIRSGPGSGGAWTHPLAESQESSVHGLPSSQSTGVPRHDPSEHLSFVVQALSSSQGAPSVLHRGVSFSRKMSASPADVRVYRPKSAVPLNDPVTYEFRLPSTAIPKPLSVPAPPMRFAQRTVPALSS